MKVDVSIIICTRNRSQRLQPLFNSLSSIYFPPAINYEIILINNASTDDTAQVIKKIEKLHDLCIRSYDVNQPGKSKALNFALSASSGDLILFADDDFLFTKNWLKSYWEAYATYSDFDCFGGRVMPFWEGPLPKWLQNGMLDMLPLPLINKVDFGNGNTPFPYPGIPGGGNSGLRKGAADKIGRFREDLGPGTSVPFAEDTEYFKRLLKLGGRFFIYTGCRSFSS